MKKKESWQEFLRERFGEFVSVDVGDTIHGVVGQHRGKLTVNGNRITEAPKSIHAAGFACWRPA